MFRARLLLITLVMSCAFTAVAEEGEVNNQTSRPRRILFDTDPGGDDIFALMWLQSLAKQGHAEIVAVTTVAGNVGGEQTFANAGRILALGGFTDVEVGRCSVRKEQDVDAAHIHGDDGVGDLSDRLPAATAHFRDARLSADIIVEKLASQPGDITLVAVGPLTNLAAAEKQRPGILQKAREVVVMGGAFRHRGNITATAEFNIFCDPEAAETVFSSARDIVVLPLDVTTQINFTPEHALAIHQVAEDPTVAEFIVELTHFLTKTTKGFRDTDGEAAGFHVHDAATLAYLFHPQTLLLQRAEVRVETKGQWTRGQTVYDQRNGAKWQANAWVAQQVDAPNLLAILSEDLKLLCAK